MFVALKIPIVAAFWLVWWATRAPETEDERPDEDDGGGGSHPREPLPRPPRRGPHGDPPPRAPQRVRAARGRSASRPARG